MKERPQTSALLFDLGGVLIRWDPRRLFRGLFPGDPAAMEQFLATVCTPAWNAAQDGGRSIAEGVAVLTAAHPAHATHIAAYYDRWEEMLGGEIAENVALVQQIAATGRPMFAITDWSAETFPIARRRYAVLDLFHGIVVSGEERCLKPSAEIFAVARRRFGLVPAETTFIDDSRENYHGARRLGYDGVHYRTPVQLRAELATRGWVAG